MKATDLFLRCLEVEGVTTIFGVPGEENADLMISLLDSPIEFVICRHEQAAAFMADMHGRLTGEPECVRADHADRPAHAPRTGASPSQGSYGGTGGRPIGDRTMRGSR